MQLQSDTQVPNALAQDIAAALFPVVVQPPAARATAGRVLAFGLGRGLGWC